jgi:hypothetical protein
MRAILVFTILLLGLTGAAPAATFAPAATCATGLSRSNSPPTEATA